MILLPETIQPPSWALVLLNQGDERCFCHKKKGVTPLNCIKKTYPRTMQNRFTIFGSFLKWGNPQIIIIIHVHRIFHYKPFSHWGIGVPPFKWKPTSSVRPETLCWLGPWSKLLRVRQRKWRKIARNPAGNHFGWWEKYQELMMRKDRRKAHSVCGMLDGNSNKLCDYVLSLTRTTGWEVLFRSQNLPKQQSEITFPQVDPSRSK